MNSSLRGLRKEIKIIVSTVSLLIVLVGWIVNGLTNHTSKVDNSILLKKQVGQVVSSQPVNTNADTYTTPLFVTVSRVVDGDTLVVLPENSTTTVTLRLIGINTPETVDPRKKVECFGKEASAKAKELLIPGTNIKIEFDPSQSSKDKYGRLLGYVFVLGTEGSELFFNKYMIEQGYAYEYTYDKAYMYQKEFKEAEVRAQTEKRGLWSETACNGEK